MSTPYISGFCGIGCHEGTKPRSPSGKPMKTCGRILTYREKSWSCACECHMKLDQMFEMTGMVRTIQTNPEYVPEKITFIMPTLEERVAQQASTAKRPVIMVESKMPDLLPPDAVHEFDATESGRKARGQLEDEVKKITDLWVAINMPDRPCTPQWVAEMIDAENPPSTGAISAVFDRWVTIGFATAEKKPTRFTGYTPDGVTKGLHAMKIEAKLKKRKAEATVNRQGR